MITMTMTTIWTFYFASNRGPSRTALLAMLTRCQAAVGKCPATTSDHRDNGGDPATTGSYHRKATKKTYDGKFEPKGDDK